MKYIDKRDGEPQETDYLRLIHGDSEFRIEDINGGIVITKVNFSDTKISIQPMVTNQILIK